MRAWSVGGLVEVAQLGSGGQGAVVVAREVASGRLVAVKYLPVAGPAAEREAQLLMRLGGEHVVRLFGYVPQPGGPGCALLMELLRGVDLGTLLDRLGRLPAEGALSVLKGSLLGLAEAHDAQVIHRDYKPGNVIVQDSGVSKLIDFGIAVLTGRSGTAGTPRYQSPEQWTGGPATPATDVYAATCVFYECVTGHPPYQAEDLQGLGYQHTAAPIPVQDLPEELRPLVLAGMAKSPADRPTDARAFVAWLEAVASAAYGPDWETRALRGLALAAAPFIAALGALSGTTAGGAAAVTTGSSGSGITRLAHSRVAQVAAAAGAVAVVGVGAYSVRQLRDHRPAAAAAAPATATGCDYRALPGTTTGLPPQKTVLAPGTKAVISSRTGTITVTLDSAVPCAVGAFAHSADQGAYSDVTCSVQRSRDGQLPSTLCSTTKPPTYTFRTGDTAPARAATCVLATQHTGPSTGTDAAFSFLCGDYVAHYPPQPVLGTVTTGATLLSPARPLTIGAVTVGVPGVTTPTLGRPWAGNQQGYGQVLPWMVFAGGDPTSVLDHVTWTSWGGPTATATGTAEYVGPTQTVAEGVQKPAVITASNLGTCEGELMYQSLHWYFPGLTTPTDSNGFDNICTG